MYLILLASCHFLIVLFKPSDLPDVAFQPLVLFILVKTWCSKLRQEIG